MENVKKFQKAIGQLELAKELRKSEVFQKAGSQGLPVGTIRIWHGQKDRDWETFSHSPY